MKSMEQLAKPNGLHLSLFAVSSDGSIGREVAVAKLGLLYADHTTICGSYGSILHAFHPDFPPDFISPDEVLEFMDVFVVVGRRILSASERQQIESGTAFVRQNLRKVKGDARRLHPAIRRLLAGFRDQIKAFLPVVAEQIGLNRLKEVVDAGEMEIRPLSLAKGLDTVTQSYINAVREEIEEGASYPLFDDTTAGKVQQAAAAGLIVPNQQSTSRARSAPIVAQLFDRFPLFETASVNELHDIR
jgi:hypothetical protein